MKRTSLILAFLLSFALITFSQVTWTRTGTNVRLTKVTDKVAIGTSATLFGGVTYKFALLGDAFFRGNVKIDSTKKLTVGSYWNPLGTNSVVNAPTFTASWSANPAYPELNIRQGSYTGPGLNNHLTFNESNYPGNQHGLINGASLQSGSSVINLTSAWNQKQINFSVGTGPQWTLDNVSLHSQDSTSKIGETWAPVGEITTKVLLLNPSYPADTGENYAKKVGFLQIGTDLYWGNGVYYKKLN